MKSKFRIIYEEVYNKGNFALFNELMAPNFVDHNPPPGVPPGIEGIKQFWTMFRAAFPDLCFTVEDTLAEGDKVMARWTARGTHKGDFMGIPATGKQAMWTGIEILRLSGGKAVEHWEEMDSLGMLQQLGIIPSPPPPGRPESSSE